MKVKCENCKSDILDTNKKCPKCGKENIHYKNPITIEELKEMYTSNIELGKDNNFCVGKDTDKLYSYGIYLDKINDKYIVYQKTDEDEKRILYEGNDEKKAVELMLLKEKIFNEKIENEIIHTNYNNSNIKKYDCSVLFVIHVILILVVLVVMLFFDVNFLIPGIILFFTINPGVFIMLPIINCIKDKNKVILVEKIWHISSIVLCVIFVTWFLLIEPYISTFDDAYYSYENTIYYQYGERWFYFDINSEDWILYDSEVNIDKFDFLSKEYDKEYHVTNFKDSDYYDKKYLSKYKYNKL